MKTTTLLVLFLFSLSCTGYSQKENKQASKENHAKILVYFFHGTHRCTGCINAEKATLAVLHELYKTQLEKGIIKFQSVNFEEDKDKALAEKYQIAWNMLLFVPANNEKGKVELTEQAFSYGTNPNGLKPYIQKVVDPMLK